MINTAVDSRCYELHEHIDADRFQLLYHSEVNWLSRGLVLKLWFELKNEVFTFLTEKKICSCSLLSQHKGCSKTCLSLWHFFTTDPADLSSRKKQQQSLTFKWKLALWTKRSQEKRRDRFPLLYDILDPPHPQGNISDSEHSQHLSQLIEKFKQYFSQHPREGHQWILDPFTLHLECQLLEVSTDCTLKLLLDCLA